MNTDSIRVLKETYDEQKPIYDLYESNDFIESEILYEVIQNTQRCCTDIWRLLCKEYKNDPVCKEGKNFEIVVDLYWPYLSRNKKPLYDNGDILEKMNGLYNFKIALYREIVNGKEHFYPIMVDQISRQLGYDGVTAYCLNIALLRGTRFVASVNSVILGKYLEKFGKMTLDEEKQKVKK